MPATSAAIIAAAQDPDLEARLVAIAAEAGVHHPTYWVSEYRHQLAAASTDNSGGTLASVYSAADENRKARLRALPPAPGRDPVAITDDQLRHAVNAVKGAPVA